MPKHLMTDSTTYSDYGLLQRKRTLGLCANQQIMHLVFLFEENHRDSGKGGKHISPLPVSQTKAERWGLRRRLQAAASGPARTG